MAAHKLGELPDLGERRGLGEPEMARPFGPPPAGPMRVARRLLWWVGAVARIELRGAVDRVRGRASAERRARHVRAILESGGGVTIRLGQQASMRLDLLSLEMCNQLAAMIDPPAPMPLEWAIARVEAAAGGPLSSRFQIFDPEPIHTNAVGANYQAVLLGGQRVVVRVRQRDIAQRMNAEQAAIGLLLRVLGPLLGVRPEFVRHMQIELQSLMLDDLDFQKVARRQSQFRRRARRDRMTRSVTATRLHMDLVRDDVIVSDFVSGITLTEVLYAADTGDADATARLRALGGDARKLGKRLLRIGWWDMFENLYFSESVDANQVVVDPNGRMTFVAMEECGALAEARLKMARRALDHLAAHDVESAVAEFIRLLEPLPPVDRHALSKRMERRLWIVLFAMENPGSPAWQRSGVGLWLAVLKTARQMKLPVRQDVLRLIRASIRYGTLATRLNPDMSYFSEFRSYLDARRRRVLRHARCTSENKRFIADTVATRMRQYVETVERVSVLTDDLVDDVPLATLANTSKGSYTLASLGWALSWTGVVALLAALMGTVQAQASGEALTASVGDALTHPAALFAILAILFVTARRILFRLEDLDPDD